jgi:signal transduction histidine kinase
VIPAAIVLGLFAERGWPPGVDPRFILADLATGWLFIGGGFILWGSRPANQTGLLMMATGATWFVSTLDPPAAFLYCGPLAHLLAAHPTGRLAGRPKHVIVAGVYVSSVVTAFRPLDGIVILIGALILVLGVVRLAESLRGVGRSSLATDVLTILVGLILLGASAVRQIGLPVGGLGLFIYQGALAATVLSIVARVVWRRSSSGLLTRIVVDLGGPGEAGTLRDRIARAVGDPSLTLGYAVAGQLDVWVDDAGGEIVRPPANADRSVTPIVVGGHEVGFVAHDPAFVGDPRVFGLIAAAAGLAISNSATQVEIRRRVAEVDASRERLVHAADAQGRRIESAIETGAESRLRRVAELLMNASMARPEDPQLRSVVVDLAAARHRLRDFARGVYPAELRSGGLVAGIEDLVGRAPIAIETVIVAVARYDPAVESTLYFVCSEALANVVKHARASHVRVELVEAHTGPVLRIEDDGVGGATSTAGFGLRGLADRVEALGGSIVVNSQPGRGTSVVASVPRGRATRWPAESVG